MGFAPIKRTCTAFFWPRQLTDRAILAIRQTQEKKKGSGGYWNCLPSAAQGQLSSLETRLCGWEHCVVNSRTYWTIAQSCQVPFKDRKIIIEYCTENAQLSNKQRPQSTCDLVEGVNTCSGPKRQGFRQEETPRPIFQPDPQSAMLQRRRGYPNLLVSFAQINSPASQRGPFLEVNVTSPLVLSIDLNNNWDCSELVGFVGLETCNYWKEECWHRQPNASAWSDFLAWRLLGWVNGCCKPAVKGWTNFGNAEVLRISRVCRSWWGGNYAWLAELRWGFCGWTLLETCC